MNYIEGQQNQGAILLKSAPQTVVNGSAVSGNFTTFVINQ